MAQSDWLFPPLRWAMAASRQLVLTRLHEVGFLHFDPPAMLRDLR